MEVYVNFELIKSNILQFLNFWHHWDSKVLVVVGQVPDNILMLASFYYHKWWNIFWQTNYSMHAIITCSKLETAQALEHYPYISPEF